MAGADDVAADLQDRGMEIGAVVKAALLSAIPFGFASICMVVSCPFLPVAGLPLTYCVMELMARLQGSVLAAVAVGLAGISCMQGIGIVWADTPNSMVQQ